MDEPLVRFDACDPRRAERSFRFDDLREVVRAESVDQVVPALRTIGQAIATGSHAAGYLAYEAAPAFDPALTVRSGRIGMPLLWFGIFGTRAETRPLPHASESASHLGSWEAALDEAEYRRRVEAIREWIAAGDSYQTNFTFPLRARFHGDDLALYARLCHAQRAAYCAFFRFEDVSILSASPELFFRWAGEELELRPMKGTRPRGRWIEEDRRLAEELLASPKERAENLMIVDLLRNDVGRIARFGSVAVPRLFEVERYPTVHQLTSTIRSKLLPGTTLTDIFRALFPSGSVTGAPKVRTMQIIAGLEEEPRGVYTGAIGFASPDEAVFSVAIRTLVLDHARGEATLGVGGGITYDSGPGAEYRECLTKAAFTRRTPADFELLESLLYERESGFFLLDGHLARLEASAGYFGFPCDLQQLRTRLREAVATLEGSAKVRLLLDERGKVRVEANPLGPPPSRPLRVRVATDPVDSADPLLYHKTTQRHVYESRAAAHPDCDDVILVNERGEITESTIANVVLRIGGEVLTPPRSAGLLPGVFRAELLERGAIREATLTPGDLASAGAVYLINSVRKWRRAVVTPG